MYFYTFSFFVLHLPYANHNKGLIDTFLCLPLSLWHWIALFQSILSTFDGILIGSHRSCSIISEHHSSDKEILPMRGQLHMPTVLDPDKTQ